jgi:arabinosyltransferase
MLRVTVPTKEASASASLLLKGFQPTRIGHHATSRATQIPLRAGWNRCVHQKTSRKSAALGLVVRASWNDVSFQSGKVVDQKAVALGMHRLLVDAGPEVTKGYTIPGQFVQIKVGDSKPGFFAIASAPDANNAGVIELLVKNAGETAEKLCSSSAGAEVSVSDVMGTGFPVDRIPPSEVQNVYIFATGSGISPIKALIESGGLDTSSRSCVTLYYGARNEESMAYAGDVEKWKTEYGVTVEPVFSENGMYVQDAFAKAGVALDKTCAAILCGQKEMALAVTDMFKEGGVDESHILTNF